MRNLLRSNFSRLWRSKLLYLGTAAVAATVLLVLFNNLYYKELWKLDITAENLLFAWLGYFPVVIAVVFSFFVGTDYNDKTIRNKLVVGESRVNIYLANLITGTVAALFMYLLGAGTVIVVGAPLLGGFTYPAAVLLLQVLWSLCAIVLLVALFTLVLMLISNMAVSVIAAVLLALGMIFLAIKLDGALSEPAFFENYVYETDANGKYDDESYTVELTENPRYLSGFSRKAVQFLHDFLPCDQIYQLGGDTLPENFARFPLYAVIFMAGCTACGVLLFKRKDLK